jgi:septum formation protein
LLEWAEVEFEVIVKHADEDYPADLPLELVPEHIALNKALAVKESLHHFAEGRTSYSLHLPILAADTVVILNNEIIGKPETRDQAVEFLSRLSGQTHQVLTGVVILHGQKEISFTDRTDVTFNTISLPEIEWYVDKYKPYDKAGAYAIQEWIGVIGIKSIQGDFYNVMGLPVSRVVRALQEITGDYSLPDVD